MSNRFAIEATQQQPERDSALDHYQAALPLLLIATRREDFVTCTPDESLGDVRSRNIEDAFDHIPVVKDDAVVGVLNIESLSTCADREMVSYHFDRLGEEILVGAEVSILEFLKDADTKPFRLLVTGHGIKGLVSLSDVQQLPVRAALFAMVTQLEMKLADLIRRSFHKDDWKHSLSPRRLERLNAEMGKAKSERNQVNPLLYTQFCDKRDLVETLVNSRSGYSSAEFRRDFKAIEGLRNDLAHANDIAVSREDAARTAQMAKTMAIWLDRLIDLDGGTEGTATTAQALC